MKFAEWANSSLLQQTVTISAVIIDEFASMKARRVHLYC